MCCLKLLPYKLFFASGGPQLFAWVGDHGLSPKVACASREVENGSLILAIKNKIVCHRL